MSDQPDPILDLETTFGALVREVRKGRNLTQQELADQLRVASEGSLSLDPSAITRIEKGKRGLRLNDVALFALVLDVHPADLIAINDAEVAVASLSLRNRLAHEAVEAAAQAIEQQRAEAEALLRERSADAVFRGRDGLLRIVQAKTSESAKTKADPSGLRVRTDIRSEVRGGAH